MRLHTKFLLVIFLILIRYGFALSAIVDTSIVCDSGNVEQYYTDSSTLSAKPFCMDSIRILMWSVKNFGKKNGYNKFIWYETRVSPLLETIRNFIIFKNGIAQNAIIRISKNGEIFQIPDYYGSEMFFEYDSLLLESVFQTNDDSSFLRVEFRFEDDGYWKVKLSGLDPGKRKKMVQFMNVKERFIRAKNCNHCL